MTGRTFSAGRTVLALALVAATAAGGGCTREVLQTGYVQDERSLSLVDTGSSREQVLLALGSPSTRTTAGDDAFYYISQTRARTFAFQNLGVKDQKVLAVYFGDDDRVERIANYTLKDGKVFDTISRTTPTASRDSTFLQQVIVGGLSGGKR